jgi:hypothetical protein
VSGTLRAQGLSANSPRRLVVRASALDSSPCGKAATRARLLLTLVIVCLAANAHAFTIRGNVVNGTTGAVVDAKVIVVNPSGGMLQEREVQTSGGKFQVDNLDPQAPIYLLRVDYDGVPYNVPVRVDGVDHDITVNVYESTSSSKGIRVSVPHLAASRQGDHLAIEQVFDVSNESEPPRTVAGEEGNFLIFIPAQMDSLTACFVTAVGVPVDRTPLPTGDPQVFRVDYPLRPGLTRIGIAYKVPYASGAFRLDARVLYDLEHVSIFAVDPEMQITSSSHTLEAGEPVHGMAAYSLHNVSKGSTLTLAFAGGSGEGMAAGDVKVVANDGHRVALFAMVPLLLVLVALIGATQRAPSPLSDARIVRDHYELLVKRLARLDDLRAAGAISEDAHGAAREEITTRLGALAMKLRTLDAATGDARPSQNVAPQETPAPAATRETA